MLMGVDELYIDSVNHRFGNTEVLSSVYLNCKIGEIVGLLGRNGSGKSTLLKIIFGAISPRYKHLKIDGEFTSKPYLTGKVAYLPQVYFMPHNLRVIDLVNLFTKTYKAQLLGVEVIRTNLAMKLGDLSGGNRRLVEALLIIYSDAKYVLLDEPFSQLGPIIIETLKEHIKNFNQHKGFIITDHYYQQILSVSTRVVLLNFGCNYSITTEEDLVLNGYLPNLE